MKFINEKLSYRKQLCCTAAGCSASDLVAFVVEAEFVQRRYTCIDFAGIVPAGVVVIFKGLGQRRIHQLKQFGVALLEQADASFALAMMDSPFP